MNTHANLSQRADQRLALVPQMLQSIEILQMSTLDLVGWLDRELAQNEVLVATPASSDPPDPTPTAEDSFDPDRFRRDHGSESSDAKHAMLANAAASGPGLHEYLRDQLVWLEITEVLRPKVELLIGLIDERGLLPLGDAELAELVGSEFVHATLAIVHALEPRGIGARTSTEAMLLQLSKGDPDFGLIEALLVNHLEDLARNRIPNVARALGVAVDDIALLLERIRELEPRPGAGFESADVQRIRPDLLVVRDPGGEFRVVVDDLVLPVLGLAPEYVRMARDKSVDRSVRSYLREKERSARDVVAAVRHRKETLARVGAALMAHQSDFLETGRAAVRPLRMSVIAEELALHNSTISRAIAGKYVQTDHGVFALREFFDGERASSSGELANAKGRMAIRFEIDRLIADEDKQDPLSDDEIVVRLRACNIEIARRTVAKYRRELGLRSSWQRRRHGNR